MFPIFVYYKNKSKCILTIVIIHILYDYILECEDILALLSVMD